jgi:hypothetical protein
MNIYLALTLFSIIILVYWVISELFAMLFRFTGLPDEKARFQVISLLTGCGFTTHESELLLTNKSRRRLARITMLFGYVFNITIVSMLINVFLSLKLSEFKNYFSILIPIISASVIITFMRVPKVRAWGDRIIERLAGRVAHRGNENSLLLIDYIGEDSISQVTLHTVPEAFRDLPLSETGLKTEHNILVMLIEHRGQKAEPATAQTVFLPDDKLTVFGNYQTIAKVFAARERFDESN